MKRHIGTFYSWSLALALTLFAAYPALAYPIEEYAHDAATIHVYRGVVFSAARADGCLYPRWVDPINGGLGGPLFSFYPPLLYFAMDSLKSLGVPHTLAWRVIVAVSLLAASSGTFTLALALFKRADIALACSVCFTYSPNLLQNLFDRGSPQGMAFALVPWLLWTLLRLARHPCGRRFGLVSLCWAIIILLHTVTALLLLPIAGVFLLYLALRHNLRNSAVCLLALVVGLLLTSFYVVPFLAECQYVQLENTTMSSYTQPVSNPLPLARVVSLPRVFDTGLGNNSMGIGVGILQTLTLALGLLLPLVQWRRRPLADLVLSVGIAALGLATIWLQTQAGTPVWAAIPALAILQFRWRLLGGVGLAAALLLGYLLEFQQGKTRSVLVVALILTCLGLQLPSLYPTLQHRYNQLSLPPTVEDAKAAALRLNLPGLTAFNELLPRWRTMAFTEEEATRVATMPLSGLPDGARIIDWKRRNGQVQVSLATPAPFRAAMHVLYFPGWAGYVDGEKRPLMPMTTTGYILVDVPAGSHTVTLKYEGTPVQHAAGLLSAITAICLVIVACLWRQGSADQVSEPLCVRPRWWLLVGLLSLVGLKSWWIDPHTTLFRLSSKCEAIAGITAQTDVWFGQSVQLCGYNISKTQLTPGSLASVTLYWRISHAVSEPVDSFVHLLGTTFNPATGNPLWGQQDKQRPGGHSLPEWVPGKLYRDTYEFRVDPQTPSGEYQLEIGLWQRSTGERLPPEIRRPCDHLSVSHLDSLLLSGITVR